MKVAETPTVILFDGPLPLKDNKPHWMTTQEDAVSREELEKRYKEQCGLLNEMLEELGASPILHGDRNPRQEKVWQAISVVNHPKGWRVNISKDLHKNARQAILKRLEKLASNREKFVRQSGGCWITKRYSQEYIDDINPHDGRHGVSCSICCP